MRCVSLVPYVILWDGILCLLWEEIGDIADQGSKSMLWRAHWVTALVWDERYPVGKLASVDTRVTANGNKSITWVTAPSRTPNLHHLLLQWWQASDIGGEGGNLLCSQMRDILWLRCCLFDHNSRGRFRKE